jgi:hypothetical protein
VGKNQKTKIVKVAAPQHVSAQDPLVISFGKWTDEALPRDVTVEVVDVDDGSDDNLDTDEDVVVRFTGTLVATEGESARLDNIKVLSVTSPARSADRVWVRFASQAKGDAVEAGIPYSPPVTAVPASKEKKTKGKKAVPEEFAANEGSFYELAARVREGHQPDGGELALSGATAVRQRAFLLLAVEPLSQNDSSMSHDVGQRILETYHPTEVAKHQPRNWDGCVIRFRSHDPMMIGSSGCSYVIVAMLVRYLRVDVPAAPPEQGEAALAPTDPVKDQTIRLWDAKIKFDELSAEVDSQPRFNIQELTPGFDTFLDISKARYEKEEAAFMAHFEAKATDAGLKPGERKSLLKDIRKSFSTKTKDKDVFMLETPAVAPGPDSADYFKTRTLTAQSYVPLLVWYINVFDKRKDGYTMRLHNLNQHELELVGASDYTTLNHEQYEQWVPQYKEIPFMNGTTRLQKCDMEAAGTEGTSAGNDYAILVPLSGNLLAKLDLISTEPHKLVADYPDDYPGDVELTPWQRFCVATLDRGLPIVGLFSPGQYSLRDNGGHFCMIVGYRYRVDPADQNKKEIRFIINDPAGGLTFQYEAHDERELNPEGLDPTAVIKEKNKKLGMERERQGLNLIIERRKLLSLREIRVYEPKDKHGASAWNTNRHARFLFYQGKLKDDLG